MKKFILTEEEKKHIMGLYEISTESESITSSDLNNPSKDAKGNKFWKKLKPELEKMGFKSDGLEHIVKNPGFLSPYDALDYYEETMTLREPFMSITYPANAADSDNKTYPNWVHVRIPNAKEKGIKVNSNNDCYANPTNNRDADGNGDWSNNSTDGFMKVWCVQEIKKLVDMVKNKK